MKPLAYLTLRSFLNGIKRSLTSGRRMISLIFVTLYYVFLVLRPMNSVYSQPDTMPGPMHFDLPPLQVVQAFIFAGFAFLSLILASSSSFQRLSFRPPDVDVLFATPLNPKIVLIFRLLRDYFFALLFPLLFVIIGWRPTASGVAALFRNLPDPHAAGYMFRVMTLAWLLMALCWVSIGYALSLFINRSDLVSDRNRKVLTYGGVGLFLAAAAYIGWKASLDHSMGGFVHLTEDPVIRVAFFTATAATAMVMSPLHGHWLPFVIAGGGLIVLTGGAILLALSQVEYLYDQAAARGFDSLRLRKMQQRGDLIAVAEDRARQGKVKVRGTAWLMRMRLKGPWALLWREVITQMRASPFIIFLFTGIAVLFAVMPRFAGTAKTGTDGVFFLSMQALSVFMSCMVVAQSGFIEVLRRVDLEKPLPFTPAAVCFFEITAKAAPAALAAWVGALVGVILRPDIWAYALASAVGLPLAGVLFCAVVFLVTVLFPDVDDPTQRGFRGLMIMLTLAIVMLPAALIAIGIIFVARDLAIAPVLGCGVGGLIALGLSMVTAYIAGGLYAQFNPSE